jgi:hypothetical protein
MTQGISPEKKLDSPIKSENEEGIDGFFSPKVNSGKPMTLGQAGE